MELTQNNISTIAVYAYMVVSPILAGYGLTIDQGTFTQFASQTALSLTQIACMEK